MRATGGHLVVRALEDEGIPFAFGIPGTHNIELYDALAASERVRPVLVTDERSASFMADAVWRSSGRLGCVNVVPGAGLTHALSGIAEAYLDTVPMLVLGCGIRRDTDHAYQLHDVDQRGIVGPVTKATFRPVAGPEIYPTIREACRLARAGSPGPVFVEIPANLYLFRHEVELPDPEAVVRGAPGRVGGGGGPAEDRRGRGSEDDSGRDDLPRAMPAGVDVDRAAAILREARRPLLHLGLGAAGAGDALVGLAEALEAPVSTTIQGKGVFPESHPLSLWPGFGDAAPAFVREIAGECDATLAVGCRFSEVGTGSYGLEPPGPLVHVDIDPEVPGRNHEAALPVTADGPAFVRVLLERLREEGGAHVDDGLRERIRRGHEEVREERLADVGGEGVTPAHLLGTLQEVFGPETVYTTDSGNGTFIAMECLRIDAPGRFLAPVDYSCMGYAVPAAVGAGLVGGGSPVVALAGDGAFLMTGLELLTAAREGVPAAVFVLRDRELAQIAQFQETALGRKTASELPDYDLAAICRGVGVECLPLASDDAVEEVVAEVRERTSAGRPVAVDVGIDYSRKTYFTRGVVRTNLGRLPVKDRLRFIGRALLRRVTG